MRDVDPDRIAMPVITAPACTSIVESTAVVPVSNEAAAPSWLLRWLRTGRHLQRQKAAVALRVASRYFGENISAFECPICFELMHEPIRLPCSHRFCRACLVAAGRYRRNCPMCRDAWPQSLLPARARGCFPIDHIVAGSDSAQAVLAAAAALDEAALRPPPRRGPERPPWVGVLEAAAHGAVAACVDDREDPHARDPERGQTSGGVCSGVQGAMDPQAQLIERGGEVGEEEIDSNGLRPFRGALVMEAEVSHFFETAFGSEVTARGSSFDRASSSRDLPQSQDTTVTFSLADVPHAAGVAQESVDGRRDELQGRPSPASQGDGANPTISDPGSLRLSSINAPCEVVPPDEGNEHAAGISSAFSGPEGERGGDETLATRNMFVVQAENISELMPRETLASPSDYIPSDNDADQRIFTFATPAPPLKGEEVSVVTDAASQLRENRRLAHEAKARAEGELRGSLIGGVWRDRYEGTGPAFGRMDQTCLSGRAQSRAERDGRREDYKAVVGHQADNGLMQPGWNEEVAVPVDATNQLVVNRRFAREARVRAEGELKGAFVGVAWCDQFHSDGAPPSRKVRTTCETPVSLDPLEQYRENRAIAKQARVRAEGLPSPARRLSAPAESHARPSGRASEVRARAQQERDAADEQHLLALRQAAAEARRARRNVQQKMRELEQGPPQIERSAHEGTLRNEFSGGPRRFDDGEENERLRRVLENARVEAGHDCLERAQLAIGFTRNCSSPNLGPRKSEPLKCADEDAEVLDRTYLPTGSARHCRSPHLGLHETDSLRHVVEDARTEADCEAFDRTRLKTGSARNSRCQNLGPNETEHLRYGAEDPRIEAGRDVFDRTKLPVGSSLSCRSPNVGPHVPATNSGLAGRRSLSAAAELTVRRRT